MSFELEKMPDNDGQSSFSLSETDEDDVTLPEPSESFVVNQITQKFEQLRQLREDLNKAFLQWIPKRKHTREKLQELATNLHEHHRNVNISTITGASMGTVGGVLSIAGLIAAPFTFGAGLVVSLVGAGIGGAGGLVMSGSKVIELILTKLGLKEVQEAIDEDREACTQLQEKLDNLEIFISTLADFLKPLHDDAQLIRELEGSGFTFLHNLLPSELTTSPEERVEFGARFFRIFSSAASVSASAFATAGTVARSAALAGTRLAHVAGSIVSAALLPLDITLLVKSSLELQRGSTSKAVEDIRQILSELECPEEEDIQLMVESFIDEKFTEAYNDDKSKAENATEKPKDVSGAGSD
ncbi:Apolipoprotein L3 [Stylophora pistillata]|uniref:Apolipoprotein L3 n=1 Tax=Stylophora pistillata TaxID=50429 RepID=A0A2B4SAI7_STYPI|nr:Apolipoprotein L3 [Stylophora pistillata]